MHQNAMINVHKDSMKDIDFVDKCGIHFSVGIMHQM